MCLHEHIIFCVTISFISLFNVFHSFLIVIFFFMPIVLEVVLVSFERVLKALSFDTKVSKNQTSTWIGWHLHPQRKTEASRRAHGLFWRPSRRLENETPKTENTPFFLWQTIHGNLKNVKLLEGFYDESLPLINQKEFYQGRKAAFINVDCDLYESAVPVFNHINDLVQLLHSFHDDF